PLATLGLWIAVHNVPWLGPAIADGLRSVLGTERVSRLEDFVYGVEDRWNQFWRKDEPPKAYWEVPETSEPPPPPDPSGSAEAGPALPPFRPADVGPMFKFLAAKGDGVWIGVPDPVAPGDPPILYKTLIHPDSKRPWAELFVVAVDLRRVELHLVAGT